MQAKEEEVSFLKDLLEAVKIFESNREACPYASQPGPNRDLARRRESQGRSKPAEEVAADVWEGKPWKGGPQPTCVAASAFINFCC